MSLLTDPRQIVTKLPPSMLEVTKHDRTRTDSQSAAKQEKSPPEKHAGKDARVVGAQDVKKPTQGKRESATFKGCCANGLCAKHNRDKPWLTYKPLIECWSLSTSQEFHGALPAPSAKTKEAVLQDAIYEHKYESERVRWGDLA